MRALWECRGSCPCHGKNRNELIQRHLYRTCAEASRVTDSAAVAHGQIETTRLRVGYYLWLLAFALLALVIHWCRRRIAGTTVGPEAKGAAPRVQPATKQTLKLTGASVQTIVAPLGIAT